MDQTKYKYNENTLFIGIGFAAVVFVSYKLLKSKRYMDVINNKSNTYEIISGKLEDHKPFSCGSGQQMSVYISTHEDKGDEDKTKDYILYQKSIDMNYKDIISIPQTPIFFDNTVMYVGGGPRKTISKKRIYNYLSSKEHFRCDNKIIYLDKNSLQKFLSYNTFFDSIWSIDPKLAKSKFRKFGAHYTQHKNIVNYDFMEAKYQKGDNVHILIEKGKRKNILISLSRNKQFIKNILRKIL